MTIAELRSFAKALRKEDREDFEQLLHEPLKHIGSISYSSSIHVWAFVLLAILLEQQKKIQRLEDDYVADRCVQT